MIRSFFKLDWILIITAILLLGLSLAILYPISSLGGELNKEKDNFFRQVVFIGIGLVVFLIFAFSDYRNWRTASSYLFFLSVFSLFLVLLFGKTIRGTSGWLNLGFFNIQPVEPFKLIIVVVLAKYFSLNAKKIQNVKHVFSSFIPVLVSLAFILKQPDLGSALVILGIWVGVLLISGIKKHHLFILLVGLLIIFLAGWNFFLKDYQKERIHVLLNPAADPLGAGYNVIQSTVAVGSGGFWGKGLGHGSQSQLNFIPEKHTDFIFAVIAEELGFSGAMFVFVLLAILLIRLFAIARASRDNFGKIMVGGFAIIISLQAMINIGMNIGLVPVAGISLPLLSYGGSALISTLAMLGIAENVYLRNRGID